MAMSSQSLVVASCKQFTLSAFNLSGFDRDGHTSSQRFQAMSLPDVHNSWGHGRGRFLTANSRVHASHLRTAPWQPASSGCLGACLGKRWAIRWRVGAPARKCRVACLVEDKQKPGKVRSGAEEDAGLLRLKERWEVPWGVKTTALTMTAWVAGVLVTGVSISLAARQLGFSRLGLDADDQALFILGNELLTTVVGLGIVYIGVRPYKPLPDNFFTIDFSQPFDAERGWLRWGVIGYFCAFAAIRLTAYLMAASTGAPPVREQADALLQLLPIIGASPTSTASLLVVTGVCAPLLEETVFRGFLMTSLTKWMPTPAAIAISAAAFGGAHLTPGELPQLIALGLVLGIFYSQTRNLATPMFIHSVWNSGVIVVLTALRLNGYDISELL